MIHRGNGKSHVSRPQINRLGGVTVEGTSPDEFRQKIQTYVAEHPAVCIAAALAVGAIAGWLIKRR